jgi:hypothetical protein
VFIVVNLLSAMRGLIWVNSIVPNRDVYTHGSRFSVFSRESYRLFRNDPYFSLDNYGSSQ